VRELLKGLEHLDVWFDLSDDPLLLGLVALVDLPGMGERLGGLGVGLAGDHAEVTAVID
jgi:hypothetical protein